MKEAEENRPKERPAVYTMGNLRAIDEEEEEELRRERETRPRLYTYPDADKCITVFGYDDLEEKSLVSLCVMTKKKQYIWQGLDFEGTEEDIKDFASKVKKHCWKDNDSDVIQSFQRQDSHSESFLDYFI